jgi:hypothetical protein
MLAGLPHDVGGFWSLSSNGTGLLGKDRAPCSALLFKEASDHAQQLHRAVGLRDIVVAARRAQK